MWCPHGFKNLGAHGKFLPVTWNPNYGMLPRTFSSAEEEQTWKALFAMDELFRRVSRMVAEHFGFAYPDGDDERVTAFICEIRQLPRDAKTFAR